MEEKNNPPTADERTLAAISHLFGMMIALIVWATQKDKSRFIRFQATQAMAFDVVVMLVAMLSLACVFLLSLMIFLVGMVAAAPVALGEGDTAGAWIFLVTLPAILPFFIWVPIMPVTVVTTIVRLVAALSVFQGRNFRYPWLGQRVEKFLGV